MKMKLNLCIALSLAIVVCAVLLAPAGFFSPETVSLAPYAGLLGMTTLASNVPRAYEMGDRNDYPVIQSDIIYEGAAVGDNGSGYARPLAAGDPFLGFAEAKVDNAAGANAAVSVRVIEEGKIAILMTEASSAVTDRGKIVYASDDNTFTFTEGTNTPIGRVSRVVDTAGNVIVEFDAGRCGLGHMAALVEGLGTADGTLADVGTAFSQTALNNNFQDLATKINTLLKQLG